MVGAAPDVLGQGLISAGRSTMPVQIKGVDPVLEPSVTDVKSAMKSGSLDALTGRGDGIPGIVLGQDLAASLGVAVGDSVQVLTLEGVLTPMGSRPLPRRRQVVGIFRLGLFEFDSTYAFVSLQDAMRLFDKQQVDFVQLRVDDVYRAPQVAAAVRARLGDQYFTEDWTVMNRSLFSALTLEKIAVSLAVGLIVLVAALNIVATLILLVMEKHRDVAILKTMGASARSVTLIFMAQGLLIGLVGTAVGAAAGYGLVVRLRSLPTDSHADRRLPGVAPAVYRRAARLRAGGRRRDSHLLRGDDLSVAASRAPRSRAGAEIRMIMQPRRHEDHEGTTKKFLVQDFFVRLRVLRVFVVELGR